MVAGAVVLGVEVDRELLRQWQQWLAPPVQPFFVESLRPWPASASRAGRLTPELRDTYKVWKLDRSLKLLWLDEEAFFALSPADRGALVSAQVRAGRGAVPPVRAWSDLFDASRLREQADGHRFVWWPSLLADRADEVLTRVVAAQSQSSRHAEVAGSTWDRCAAILPGAAALAGTFPTSSGANCFGTVMAAAGVRDVADEWMLQEPFLTWLDSACRPGSAGDQSPGTVLVWRDRDGAPVHAAVTIGDGWALEKPSQEWSTPRVVSMVSDVIRINRCAGHRLERHALARTAEYVS